MIAALGRLSSLREQAEILARLEEIIAADEQSVAEGRIEIAEEREQVRKDLLARLERVSRGIGGAECPESAGSAESDDGASIADRSSQLRRATGERAGGRSQPAPRNRADRKDRPDSDGSNDEESTLARANRDRMRELEVRTRTLLAGWHDRRESALTSIGAIQSGKRMLASWGSGGAGRSDFDVKG